METAHVAGPRNEKRITILTLKVDRTKVHNASAFRTVGEMIRPTQLLSVATRQSD